MRSPMRKIVCWSLGLAFVLRAAAAVAAPMTFYFTFEEDMGPAKAEGFITLETSLLPNPNAADCDNDDLSIPGPVVLALEVTVSGATDGNGTFNILQFHHVAWCTGGGTLDLSMQLVGQATSGDPWGTPSGNGGDFNLFSGPPRPSGEFFFTLCADGGSSNCMELTSMIVGPLILPPPPRLAPAVGPAGLAAVALAMLALGIHGLRRRAA